MLWPRNNIPTLTPAINATISSLFLCVSHHDEDMARDCRHTRDLILNCEFSFISCLYWLRCCGCSSCHRPPGTPRPPLHPHREKFTNVVSAHPSPSPRFLQIFTTDDPFLFSIHNRRPLYETTYHSRYCEILMPVLGLQACDFSLASRPPLLTFPRCHHGSFLPQEKTSARKDAIIVSDG